MKEINRYYVGYNGQEENIEHIKYNLLNEFGYNIDSRNKEYYNEEKIIKTRCNHKG